MGENMPRRGIEPQTKEDNVRRPVPKREEPKTSKEKADDAIEQIFGETPEQDG